MGITHSWYRPHTIDVSRMQLIKSDFMAVIPALPGSRAINLDDRKLFGNEKDDLIFSGAYETCEPFEFRRVSLSRVITLDRAREPWQVDMVFEYCKTEGLPYDAAVKIALLIIKRTLKDSVRIFTDQKCDSWKNELAICRKLYGDNIEVIKHELILL